MLSRIAIALALTLALVTQASPAIAAGLELAADGKARVTIVVNSQGAITAEKTAARELAEYFQKISGATFSIVEESQFTGGPAIYVGQTRYAKERGVDVTNFGEEESLLRTTGDALIITGGRTRGTLYAVYELLDRDLGVRWYTPWQERVPSAKTLKIPAMDRQFKPAYEYRFNNAFSGAWPWLRDVTLPPHIPVPGRTDTVRWMARNRMNVGLKYLTKFGDGGQWIEWPEEYGGQVVLRDPTNHSFDYFIPDAQYFKTNPEYFSLREGKRVPAGDHTVAGGMSHLCLSNEELPGVFAANMIKWIKANPQAYYAAIIPNDAARTMCDCDKCREIALKYMPPGTTRDNSHEAGLLIYFVNKVVEIVCKEYPNQRFLTLSYNYSEAPPVGITVHPNVIVQMCGGGVATAVRINPNIEVSKRDRLRYDGWEKACKRLWVWDYQCGLVPGIDNFKPMLWAMDETFKKFAKRGGYTGMFIEAEWNCPPVIPDCYELNTWLSAKLMCDPTIDIEPMIREYCDATYGKASPAVQALLQLKKSRLSSYPIRAVNYEFMQKAQALMAEAEKAVADDPVASDKLLDVRINLDLAALQYRYALRDEHRASGKEPASYPWPVAMLRKRVFDSLQRATNYWWYSKNVQYWKSSATFNVYPHGEKQFREMLVEYLDVICQGSEEAPPLPPELQSIPRQRVVDVSWPLLMGNVITELELDEKAAAGVALCVDTNTPWYVKNGRTPIPIFLYDYSGTVSYAGKKTPDGNGTMSAEIKPELVTEPGYRWYSAPPGRIGPGTRTILSKSWGHQVNLAELSDPEEPDALWKVYWSVRLSGPNYPPSGRVYERDALLVDRMIFVKVAPGQTLPDTLTPVQPVSAKVSR